MVESEDMASGQPLDGEQHISTTMPENAHGRGISTTQSVNTHTLHPLKFIAEHIITKGAIIIGKH